jgi:hypothetical protein
MKAHWATKSQRRGRPKKAADNPLVTQQEEFNHERYALETKMGWLELLLKQATEDRDYAQKILKSIRQPIKNFEVADLKKKT